MAGQAGMVRVLVIDDDDLVRDTLGFMVESAGHSAIIAKSAEEGLLAMETGPADIVVTDMFMPDRNGIEFISELRRRFPQTRIIAISGGGQAGDVEILEAAQNAGATAVLQKPFGPEELDETIAHVLSAQA